MSLHLSDIVSISGKPGLYKVVGRRTTGLIVESLDGTAKRFPTTMTQKVSFLSDISMYTYEGDEKLAAILKNLNAKISSGLTLVTKKNSGDEIETFFRAVLENFDEGQVYKSDILKLVSWYEILKDQVNFDELMAPETDASEAEVAPKKAAPKKAATPKSTPKAQSKAKGGVKKAGNLKAG